MTRGIYINMKKRNLKIFVSYTRLDNIVHMDFLIKLNNFLKTFSHPFIDLIHNNSLEKQMRIEKEISIADYLILLRTHSTFDSQWVQKELSIAKEMDIPILEFDYNELLISNFNLIKKEIFQYCI